MPRTAQPQISFADWELLQQGLVLEPLLQSISDFLDDHEEMIEAVRGDLEQGLKNPGTGRKGLTTQQVLRSLILKRVKNWDFRELRERIADGYTLRQFTDFYCQPVPKHDAFNRAFNRLTPKTLQAVNPAADAQGTTRTTNREISPTHRSDRGSREQRAKGSGADPQSTRQGSARRNGHPRTSQGDRPLL